MRKLARSIGYSAMLLASSAILATSAHGSPLPASSLDSSDLHSSDLHSSDLHSSDLHSSDLYSNNCEFALNYDVSLAPSLLKFSTGNTEIYRIDAGTLYIQDKRIGLTPKQEKLLSQYAAEISAQLPEVIDLVNDAMSIASSAASMALTPLLGDDAGGKLEQVLLGLQRRLDSITYQDGDKFYLGSTQASLVNTFDAQFAQELEQLISSSLGNMMLKLGSELLAGDGDSFEQKMLDFGDKMARVGDDIEVQMHAQAQELEARAANMCARFAQLVVLDHSVRSGVPQLSFINK